MESGVATVNYAYNAYFIVAGVFSYALTNMFFPEMSRRFASRDTDGATDICRDMLSTITAVIMPIMVFLAAVSEPIIRIIYQRGKFTAQDTVSVALLLTVYAFGMIFLSWQDILNKFFYSMQKSVVPMIAAASGIAVNLILSLILSPFMGLTGLALSTVIAGALMTLILSLFTLKYTRNIFKKDFAAEILKLVIGGAAVFAACSLMLRVLNFNTAVLWQSIMYTLLTFAAALAVYLGVLFILRSKSINNIINLFGKGGKTDDIQ